MKWLYKRMRGLLLNLLLILVVMGVFSVNAATQQGINTVTRKPINMLRTQRPVQPTVTRQITPAPVREDYFVSADTVVIGCTAGMAAGVLVGSVPVAGAMMSGIGGPESIALLVNLTGMGCGVGAVSSAVAIFTAWMLNAH